MTSTPFSVLILAALMSLSCYQTSTSNERTVRTNTVTGKSERLSGTKWVPIEEARPTARPIALSAEQLDRCAKASQEPEPGKRLSELDQLRILGLCP